MYLPLITAGKGFDGNEFLATLDHVLTDIDFAPNLARAAIVDGRLEGQGLIDQGAIDAMMMLIIVMVALFDLELDIVRCHRHGDDLAMGVGDAGAGRGPEILEYQDIAQAFIHGIELLHAIAVGAEELLQMVFIHFVQGRTVFGVVDNDLVAPIAVDGLLQAETEPRIGFIVAQYRIQIFHDTHVPIACGGIGHDRRRCHVLIADAKGAGLHMLAGIPRGRGLGLFWA